MSKEIDRVLEEANVLYTTTLKFPTEMAAVGITAEKVTDFGSQIETLRNKDATFHDSKQQVVQKSGEQKSVVADVIKLIQRVKNAADIAFVNDTVTRKAFRIEIKPTTAIAKIITSLAHLKESATANKEVLIQSGMKQADLDEMDTLISSLTESENKQEDSKHVRTTHLMEMNAIVKEINKTMFIIRKAAAIAFQDKPEILQQFKPVTRKKSSAKTETTTETTTSEAGTNG